MVSYGQTGAGKSHTMWGEPGSFHRNKELPSDAQKTVSSGDESDGPVAWDCPHHFGLIPRTITKIFRACKNSRCVLTVSAVQCKDNVTKHSLDILGNHIVYLDDKNQYVGLTEEIIDSEESLSYYLGVLETLKFREAASKTDTY